MLTSDSRFEPAATGSTAAHPPKNLDALRAAQLYYLQDQTMEAIAHDLHTSRSSVSRLLSHARATGLVEINVRSPLDQSNRVQRELYSRFGVTSHVVPMPNQITDVDRLERVAITAARLLGEFVDSNMTLGIAWGSTISAISRHLLVKETTNVKIVQLNGAGNTQSTGIDYSSEILQRFGAAFGANGPAVSRAHVLRPKRDQGRDVARTVHQTRRRPAAKNGCRPVRPWLAVRRLCPAGSTSANIWNPRTTSR